MDQTNEKLDRILKAVDDGHLDRNRILKVVDGRVENTESLREIKANQMKIIGILDSHGDQLAGHERRIHQLEAGQPRAH